MSDSVVAEARRLAEALAADPDRIEAEISGMSDEQMAYSADDPVWARWSAEMNLRHIALLSCRWFNRLRGPLEERGYTFPEVEMEAVMSGNGRHIPPAICPDTASLLAFIRAHCDLASGILSREGDETLRGISGERVVDPEASYTVRRALHRLRPHSGPAPPLRLDRGPRPSGPLPGRDDRRPPADSLGDSRPP